MKNKLSPDEREFVLSKLAHMASAADEISQTVGGLEHPRGRLHDCLKPKSGMYLVHSEGSFTAEYRDPETGRAYTFIVHISPQVRGETQENKNGRKV